MNVSEQLTPRDRAMKRVGHVHHSSGKPAVMVIGFENHIQNGRGLTILFDNFTESTEAQRKLVDILECVQIEALEQERASLCLHMHPIDLSEHGGA